MQRRRLNIYAPFIRDTATSFEQEVPSLEQWSERVRTTQLRFPWLVAEEGESILGYAYAGAHRARTAYQWSTELSVYVAPQGRRRGVARQLYTVLMELVRLQGFVNAYGGYIPPQ